MARKLTIATSQFAVVSDIGKNLSVMQKHIRKAAKQKADIVHFSECCLSGYAGIDFDEYTPGAEALIKKGISEICSTAKANRIRVVFGSHFFEGKSKKPFNSLFLIDPQGGIKLRYDKRLLAEFDTDWYKAGSQPGVFEINGIKCGLLICHEWRYPELYRQYYHLGVDVLFQSWYDGNYTGDEFENEGRLLGEVIPGYVRGNAANNRLWVSGANTSKKEQSFPAFVCRPDGGLAGKLKRNVAGLLITEIDVDRKFLDLSHHLRDKVSRMRY